MHSDRLEPDSKTEFRALCLKKAGAIVGADKEFLPSCFAGGDLARGDEPLGACPEMNLSDPVPQQDVVTQAGLLSIVLLALVS